MNWDKLELLNLNAATISMGCHRLQQDCNTQHIKVYLLIGNRSWGKAPAYNYWESQIFKFKEGMCRSCSSSGIVLINARAKTRPWNRSSEGTSFNKYGSWFQLKSWATSFVTMVDSFDNKRAAESNLRQCDQMLD